MFDVSPSATRIVLWENSLADIETRTKIKLGFEQAVLVQGYQTLISVVSSALGGKPNRSHENEDVTLPQDPKDIQAAFKAVFGG